MRGDWRKIVVAVTGNQSAMRCDACRATGVLHCAGVWDDDCGGMRDYTAEEVLVALSARDERSVSALKEIARQKLTKEMDDDMAIAASFEDGYNECVRVAREALENK